MRLLHFSFCLLLTLGEAAPEWALPKTPQSESPFRTNASPGEISRLRERAEAGDADAQFQLGKAYLNGNGVAQDDKLALAWYNKAVEQGNSAAANQLGLMHRLGRGVEKNEEEAVRWYHKGAKLGSAEAMFNLGACYYNGEGVGENPVKAFVWFLLAQEAGDSAAQDAVRRSTAEMAPLSIRDAILEIGDMYEKGDELPQSYAKAASWYRKESADSAEIATKLATLLLNGNGVERDYGEAMELCRSAAKKGYSPAQYCVGLIYQRGLGVPADAKQSAKWYTMAATTGHVRAELALAEMYSKGEGVGVDRPEAYYLLLLAYKGGAQEARLQAHSLRQEMSKDEVKKLDAKLRMHRFDPKQIYAIVDDPSPPDPAKTRQVLPPVAR